MKDALDALLDRYAPEAGAGWLAAETPDIVPEHPFSSKFRRRMERLIRRQRRSPAVTAALRCARRAAAYALVFLTLSFSCLMTVDASFREQVLRVVVEVLQEFTEFRYTSDLPASGQPGEVRFTYLPEGMEEILEYREQDEMHHYYYFMGKEEQMLSVEWVRVDEEITDTYLLDTENANISYVEIQGTKAIVVEKGEGHVLHFTRENFVYTLSGSISTDELIMVANGMQECK